MKKKKVFKKLSFEKLTIAKLSNSVTIKGGSNNCTQNGTLLTEYCMPTGENCDTLTLVGPTTVGDRPTKVVSKCNCYITGN